MCSCLRPASFAQRPVPGCHHGMGVQSLFFSHCWQRSIASMYQTFTCGWTFGFLETRSVTVRGGQIFLLGAQEPPQCLRGRRREAVGHGSGSHHLL